MTLMNNLGHFADFPIPGIKFIDILPLFRDPAVHLDLLRALELQILEEFGDDLAHKPDVIVGLDARGFLFGPSIALRLNAGFVPVRKKGKMPGPCVTAAYEKEYGTDYFQMQEGAIKPGQKVLVVDDIIATGKHTLLLWPMLTVSRHCPSIENGPWLPAAPPIASKKLPEQISARLVPSWKYKPRNLVGGVSAVHGISLTHHLDCLPGRGLCVHCADMFSLLPQAALRRLRPRSSSSWAVS
jgi:adenine phosphoribosyltransferase